MPNLSSKSNFIYPKLLEPLGNNAIASLNPLSLFPGGISEYTAPKKANFADYPFFLKNRSLKLTTATNTEEGDRKDSADRVQKIPQRLISPKSNIQSDFFDSRDDGRQLPTTHNLENSTVEPEIVSPRLDTDASSRVERPQTTSGSNTPSQLQANTRQPTTSSGMEEIVSPRRASAERPPTTPKVESEIVSPQLNTDASSRVERTNITQSDTPSQLQADPRQPNISSGKEEIVSPQRASTERSPTTPKVESEIVSHKLDTDASSRVERIDIPQSDASSQLQADPRQPNIPSGMEEIVSPQRDLTDQPPTTPKVESEIVSPKLDTDASSRVERPQTTSGLNTPSQLRAEAGQPNIPSGMEEIISPRRASAERSPTTNTKVEPEIVSPKLDTDALSRVERIDIPQSDAPSQLRAEAGQPNIPSSAEEIVSPQLDSTDQPPTTPKVEPEIISPQLDAGVSSSHKKEYLPTPDRWSNISELIEDSTLNNTKQNTKYKDDINSVREAISQSNNLSSNSKLKNNRSNNSINPSTIQRKKVVKNNKTREKIKLTSENSLASGYQYKTVSNRASSKQPVVQRTPSNSNLSSKKKTLTANKTIEEERKEKEQEKTKIDLLINLISKKVYYLIKQKLKIEKARQGRYYT